MVVGSSLVTVTITKYLQLYIFFFYLGLIRIDKTGLIEPIKTRFRVNLLMEDKLLRQIIMQEKST